MCSSVVIHQEKCWARQTRRRQSREYASSGPVSPEEYQTARASVSTVTSNAARFRPLAPVGGTMWAASPASSSRPNCIGSATKLRMAVMPFSRTGPVARLQPGTVSSRAASSAQIRSSGQSAMSSSGATCR